MINLIFLSLNKTVIFLWMQPEKEFSAVCRRGTKRLQGFSRYPWLTLEVLQLDDDGIDHRVGVCLRPCLPWRRHCLPASKYISVPLSCRSRRIRQVVVGRPLRMSEGGSHEASARGAQSVQAAAATFLLWSRATKTSSRRRGDPSSFPRCLRISDSDVACVCVWAAMMDTLRISVFFYVTVHMSPSYLLVLGDLDTGTNILYYMCTCWNVIYSN